MPFPNFIIAGPPKCGTTSVFNWLAQHPDVHTSVVKETYFFYSADEKENGIKVFQKEDFEKYEQLFEGYNGEKIICEATPGYIYSESALKAFENIESPLKVLFIYRDPVDRIYSEFKFHKYKTKRYNKGFREYSGYTQDGTFSGSMVDEGKYVDYISKWVDSFGRKNVLILDFEDLKNNPNEFISNVCSFLEIDNSFYNEFDFRAKNKTVNLRNRKLHMKLLGLLDLLPNKLVNTLAPIYYKLNTQKLPDITTDEKKLLVELRSYYTFWDEKLYMELGDIIKTNSKTTI